MTRVRLALALAALVLSAQGAHAAAPGLKARMIAAAKATPVRAIDYDDDRCDRRTVAQWLSALSGANVRAVSWTAGGCQLVGMGIDQGSSWCAQASLVLKRPKGRDDQPMVEIFFEHPVRGRPGRAYAFRGVMAASDGVNISRYRKEFEYDWTTRFKPPAGAIVDCPDAG